MPGGDPIETLSRFHSIDPDVRTIVMSGLSELEIVAKINDETIDYFLAKPFTYSSFIAGAQRYAKLIIGELLTLAQGD